MQAIPPTFLAPHCFPAPFARPDTPFAGKRGIFPEKRVNASLRDHTLAFGRRNQRAAREINMTQETTTGRNIRGTLGSTLLVIGSTVLVGYSAALVWQFQAALDSATLDSVGFLGSIGLASLHAVRIVALDHAVLLSVVHRILVLCSALIVTLIGITLLRKRATGVAAPGKRAVSALPEGDQ